MRLVTIVVVLGLSTSASADKKIQGLIPQLEREHAGCVTQTSGLLKVATGATALAKTLEGTERDEVVADADRLTKGHAAFVEYCAEVASLVTYLKENSAAAYRSVEREIDTRDNKLRKLRREGKRLLEDLQPITRKMIPRIARVPTAAVDEKRTPGKFPSGRTVDLPALAGTWRLSGTAKDDEVAYSDKTVVANLDVRSVTVPCTDQRKALEAKPDIEQLTDLVVPRASEVSFAVRYLRREQPGAQAHLIITMCVARPNGGISAFAFINPATSKIADDITKLMLRMLVAYEPKSKP